MPKKDSRSNNGHSELGRDASQRHNNNHMLLRYSSTQEKEREL